MDTPHPSDRCGPGHRYPRRVRELAFQLWAFKCSRYLTCVAEELTYVGRAERWDCIPGERTLRHWATKGDWAAATARALRAIAPDLMEGLVTDLIMGAAEGVTYLREVLSGRVGQPNSTRIRAILTALSMIGVPDQAHATIRNAMLERDAAQPLPAQTIAQRDTPSSSTTAWKEQLAVRLGLTSQAASTGDDAVPPPGQGEGANGRDRCSS